MHDIDKRLAKEMVAGRDRAFRAFFDQYFPRVYRFCSRRLPDAAAEEVAQATLINAIRWIASYRGEASLFTWLCQIARREISDHYERAARHQQVVSFEDSEAVRAELESLSADPDLLPGALVDRHKVQELVQVVLDHLPGDYGRVLEMKYIQGFSVNEIAEQLATTSIAVQSMLARARNAFRKEYGALAGEMMTLSGAGRPAPGAAND